MTDSIDNYDDVIDSRDVIARIEELEADIVVAWHEQHPDRDDEDPLDFGLDCHTYLDYDDATELNALRELAREGEMFSEWTYGETLIRETYFVDYCREMLDDCGYLPDDLPSFIVVDWEATANNMRVDYSTIEFSGVDYYIR